MNKPTDADRALVRELRVVPVYNNKFYGSDIETLATTLAQARREGAEAMREKVMGVIECHLTPNVAELIAIVIRALPTGKGS